MKYGEKEIEVVASPKGYHYSLRFTTGGEIPAALSGMYTSRTEAAKAVEAFPKPEAKASKKTVKEVEEES
jgi:hypothetical protein